MLFVIVQEARRVCESAEVKRKRVEVRRSRHGRQVVKGGGDERRISTITR